jgi:sn-glycerol 3-phosphate transport system ATP-binding protein
MGRAIVREPKAFLFDEPLSNLDAKLRGQVRVEIKRLQRRLATTSLYVTHDQVEAMTLADRLVVMNQGAAEQIGTPDQIYSKPASLFVAGFIGAPAMNIVDGTIAPDGQSVRLGGAGAPALPLERPAAAGRALKVGLRPEHLVTTANGPLALAIELVENLGADALLHGKVQGGAALVARVDGGAPLRAGETLRLDIAPRHVHLFDPAGARRLAD